MCFNIIVGWLNIPPILTGRFFVAPPLRFHAPLLSLKKLKKVVKERKKEVLKMKKVYCDVIVWKFVNNSSAFNSNIDVFNRGGTKHILALHLDFSNGSLYSKNHYTKFRMVKKYDDIANGFYELDLLGVKSITENHAIYTGCLIIDEERYY